MAHKAFDKLRDKMHTLHFMPGIKSLREGQQKVGLSDLLSWQTEQNYLSLVTFSDEPIFLY